MPVGLAGKIILKAAPQIYISDSAIRNAVLMLFCISWGMQRRWGIRGKKDD